MKIVKENIKSFIPHREPFIMIDNLLDATAKDFESDFLILPGNIFVKNGILQEAALVENIAQTCAAGFGFLQRKEDSPGLGFIASISKLVIHILPAVNGRLKTRVAITHQLENIIAIWGKSYCDEKKLLECEMKIVIN